MDRIDRRCCAAVAVVPAAVLSACGAHTQASTAPGPVRGSPGVTTITDVFGPGCNRLPPDGQTGSLSAMTHQSAAVAIASTPVLSDFATALRSTPTDSLLGRDRGITVFAPDTDAFDKLYRMIGEDAFADLRDNVDRGSFLPHHIANARLTRDNLTTAGRVDVLDGDRLTVADSGSTITIADRGRAPAHVVCGNIPTVNATVFITDTVLISPGSQLAQARAPKSVRCAPNPHAYDDADCVSTPPPPRRR